MVIDRVDGRWNVPAPVGPAVTTAFAVAWALANLFDKSWFGHWRWSPTNLLLVAACGWLLLRPRSARALFAVAVIQIADWFSDQSILERVMHSRCLLPMVGHGKEALPQRCHG